MHAHGADVIAIKLDLGEATQLASAWVAAIASRLDIRVLLVKGPTLQHYRLRPPRTSADLDVIVEPHRLGEFCSAITANGWRKRPQTEVGTVWASHSITYLHDSWPCDIDVHRYFPGFLDEPEAVFEDLWTDRNYITLAHQEVPIPSREASLIVAALHQLRDGASRVNEAELTALTRTDLTDAEREQVVSVASRTGALEPLRDFLLSIGVAGDQLPHHVDSAELRAWNARIDADASGAYFWLLLLGLTPPRERIGLIVRALWPPRSDLHINSPGTRDTMLSRATARLRRIPKGIRGLPRAIRALHVRPRTPASRRRATGK